MSHHLENMTDKGTTAGTTHKCFFFLFSKGPCVSVLALTQKHVWREHCQVADLEKRHIIIH
jgi:hypothetical protein